MLKAVSTALARDWSTAYPPSSSQLLPRSESSESNLFYAASQALEHDDAASFAGALKKATNSKLWEPNFLYLSLVKGSDACFEHLVGHDQHVCWTGAQLSWILAKIGRQAHVLRDCPNMLSGNSTVHLSVVDLDKTSSMLCRIIDAIGAVSKKQLWQEDSFGCLPLHYAVKYGLLEISKCLLYHMRDMPCAALQQNKSGFSPLTIAVLRSSGPITDILLYELQRSRQSEASTAGGLINPELDALLALAVCSQSRAVVRLLLSAGANATWKGHNDETALLLAVRTEQTEHVMLILQANEETHLKIDIDSQEAIRGLTPLMIACRRGNRPMTRRLLRNAANPFVKDFRGWTARDHAAFKGWEVIVSDLMAVESHHDGNELPISSTFKRSFADSGFPSYMKNNEPSEFAEVFVNLGALDTYHYVPPVDLSPLTSPKTFDLQEEGHYLLEVGSLTENQTTYTIQLPIIGDTANKPLRFISRHPETFILAFDLYRCLNYDRGKRSRIGRATALLNHLKRGLGKKRESLIRDFTIPITETNTLNHAGFLTFYFLVVAPFRAHSTAESAKQKLHLDEKKKPIVIGHRGKNGKSCPIRSLTACRYWPERPKSSTTSNWGEYNGCEIPGIIWAQ